MVFESEGGLPKFSLQNTMTNTELTLSRLRGIRGSGTPENEYGNLQKPKAKKEIKSLKPLTRKDVMNNGGSPGPFLPGPDCIHQAAYGGFGLSETWI